MEITKVVSWEILMRNDTLIRDLCVWPYDTIRKIYFLVRVVNVIWCGLLVVLECFFMRYPPHVQLWVSFDGVLPVMQMAPWIMQCTAARHHCSGWWRLVYRSQFPWALMPRTDHGGWLKCTNLGSHLNFGHSSWPWRSSDRTSDGRLVFNYVQRSIWILPQEYV